MSEIEEFKPRNWELLVCLVLFALWILPALFIDKPEVKVLGIPVLWFYYMILSAITSLAVTLMYLTEKR